MGDSKEITVWPKNQDIYYRVSASAICFDIKAPRNALIILTNKPGNKAYYYTICIGAYFGDRTWITNGYGRRKSAYTPNILSRDEYKSFWLTWFGASVKLGRHGEDKPIVSYSKYCTCDYKFIAFSVFGFGVRNPVNYRFDVPPHLMEPVRLKPLSDEKLQWVNVDADLQLPDGAVIGGFENETLYIMRAHHRGSLTPGKFARSEGVGYIPLGGQVNEKTQFQVLCGMDCMWILTTDNRIPVGAVEGGYTEQSESGQERLFIGRAFHQGHLIPGKVQPSHKVCYIPYEGQEIGKKTFEILVHPLQYSRRIHKMHIPDMNAPSKFSFDCESFDESDHNDNDEDEENDVYYDI